ncbi:hypothetical protein GQ53DRAFT_846310 [Thozetella sp. PMI_491]|nr:hypothetical protein GQ53DRAFT_846310 [Thozetella sp. PMI_491]
MYWKKLFGLAALAVPGLCAAIGQPSAGDLARSVALETRQAASTLATWLWQSTLVADSAGTAQFLSFCRANGVTKVYVQIDPDIQAAAWQSFIAQCAAAGITVDALMGNHEWVIGSGKPTLQDSLDWIKQFQGSAPANSKFAGIHMDVEPWAFADWDSNQSFYIQGWQNVVQQVSTFGKQLNMPVAADLPFWTYTLTSPTTGQTLDLWLLNVLDSATFMTYRNTAAGVVSLTPPILSAAHATGKRVWFAVETTQVEEGNVSYFGKSAATLASDLKQIASSAAGDTSFAGIGVHDYNGWRALS